MAVDARRAQYPSLLLGGGLCTAVAVTLLVLWAGGSAAEQVPGIQGPGALTTWALPVARTVANAAAVVVIGALVFVVVLLPGGRRLDDTRLRYMKWAAVASAVWAIASAALLVFTLSDLFARPVGQVLAPDVLADFVLTDAQGRSYALMAGAGTILATVCLGVGTARWAGAALLLAVAGLLPPAFTGHSAGAGNHDAAVTSLALHLVGAAVWVGGLALLLVAAVKRDPGLDTAVRRFSSLALGAFLAVAASGVVNAVVRLPSAADVFTSRYGLMVLLKTVALVILGALGWWHRQRVLPTIAGESRRPFIRLAAGELLVMAAAMGLATALSRTPPPGAGDPALSPAEELLGFAMPPPLGDFPWTPLFTQWHFDPLFAFGTAAAAAAYLAAVHKLRARGDRWPLGRTIAWMAGLGVTVLATMSGLAVYGKVMFSVHMGQHMILAMTVPILLVLGAPATLALRTLPTAAKGGTAGPRELLLALLHSRYVKVISHPVVAGVLFIASAFAVYYTSLFENLMRSHLGHTVMLAHFLAVGLLFFWVIIGMDPGPRRLPYLGRLFVLILTMPFHSWFSISVMSSTDIIGEGWWTDVGRTWGETLADDQYNGGAIAWATGDIPVLLTTIVLAAQWVRSDAREARRIDRRIDRGDANDPLAAYNAYLASLHARDRKPRPAVPVPARKKTPRTPGGTLPPARSPKTPEDS